MLCFFQISLFATPSPEKWLYVHSLAIVSSGSARSDNDVWYLKLSSIFPKPKKIKNIRTDWTVSAGVWAENLRNDNQNRSLTEILPTAFSINHE